MKKRYLLGLLIVLITLSACGSNEDTDTTNDETATNENSNVLQVSYPSWWEDWFVDLKADFEEQNEGIEVELIPLFDDTTTKQAMMMQSPETAPDVAVEDTFVLNSDVNADYLSSMQEMVDNWDEWDQITDTVKEGVTAENGEVYGVPFSTDVQGLWFNKEIFSEAGIEDFAPESWTDILDAARTIRDEGPDVIPLFIYATKATGEATSMRTFQTLYSGTGSELYNVDESKWVIDTPALEDTFSFIQTVYEENLGPSLSVASNSQVGTQLAEQMMPDNEVAMVIDGNWVTGTWRRGDTAEPYDNAMDIWGFLPLPTQEGQDPGFTSMSGGWAFSIPTHAGNKELAEEFIQMAVDQEHQLDYVLQTGDMTVRSDVAESENYLNQEVSNYKEADEILEYTNFRPTADAYATISTHIQEVVENVASGSYTPEEAAQQYEEGLIRIVGEDHIIKN